MIYKLLIINQKAENMKKKIILINKFTKKAPKSYIIEHKKMTCIKLRPQILND